MSHDVKLLFCSIMQIGRALGYECADTHCVWYDSKLELGMICRSGVAVIANHQVVCVHSIGMMGLALKKLYESVVNPNENTIASTARLCPRGI